MESNVSIPVALFAATVLFCAYTVRGIAGFGSGLIAIPLLALSFPLTLVVPLVVLLDFVGSAGQGVRNRALVSWRDLAPLLPFTVLGVLAALYLMDTLDAVVLRRSLGVFVLVYALYQLSPLPAVRTTRLSSVPYGALGGLVGTLFGTGGPFYVIYLSMRGLDKGALRASFATWFVIDGALRLGGYAAFGFLSADTLLKAAVALPVAVLGLLLGGRIHTTVSQQSFRRVISILLLVSGCGLLLKP
jgi:hypothetical protein